jgi:chromosomal replication initiator protein
MYLLRHELNLSFPIIASEVGIENHTTVMHGVKKIEQDIKLDFSLREKIEAVKEKIYG